MTTNQINHRDNKKDTNGKCFKKLNRQCGRKVQSITIKNGIILFKILTNNLRKNLFYLKMILTFLLWKLIWKKEKRGE